jgi:mRNA-degrading endonuclease toxin of MazEF toxin-antitoxin module
MRKLYRGEVILVWAPDGKNGLKPRPVVVLRDNKKNDDAVSVYCTTKNNGDDANNIFVEASSEEGQKMGLTEDTYIRPKNILTIPCVSIIRPIGKCSLLHDIGRIIDNNMAR